jgi:hypothetical protein
MQPSGDANAGAGCRPTPVEHIPSGSDRVRVGLLSAMVDRFRVTAYSLGLFSTRELLDSSFGCSGFHPKIRAYMPEACRRPRRVPEERYS